MNISTTNRSNDAFRHDIQGMRGFSIILVLMYHFGVGGINGGFLGVDIFFVISGWVITTLLVRQLTSDNFSAVIFISRRLLRLLPSLVVITFFVLVVGLIFLIPMHLADTAKSVLPSLFFISNWHFYKANSYFDVGSGLKPLQHTWSLAIEMQFYVIWAAILKFSIISKKGTLNRLFWPSTLLLIFSFIFAQIIVSEHREAAFYLLPSRAWELAIGSIGALLSNRILNLDTTVLIRISLRILGISIILISVAYFDQSTETPSYLTIAPVFGTVLILLFPEKGDFIDRVLSSRALMYVGNISYSLYLWHFVILVFARHIVMTEFNLLMKIFLIVISLILAFLNYKFIENPLRKMQVSPKLGFVGLSLIIPLLMGSYYLVQKDGLRQRLPDNVTFQSLGDKLRAQGDICDFVQSENYEGVEFCYFGNTNVLNTEQTVALYGDSHAQALSFAIDEEFKQRDLRGLRVKLKDCSVIPNLVQVGTEIPSTERCPIRFENLFQFLQSEANVTIISSRWSFNLYPIKGHIEDMPYRNSEGGVEWTNWREYAILKPDGTLGFDGKIKTKAINDLIYHLSLSTKRLVLVYPIPENAWKVAESNFVFSQLHGRLLPELSQPSIDYIRRNKFIEEVLDQNNYDNLTRVRPYSVFCNSFKNKRCVAQWNGTPLYYDYDHLSIQGARLLTKEILRALYK